jgi:hypothetical protein
MQSDSPVLMLSRATMPQRMFGRCLSGNSSWDSGKTMTIRPHSGDRQSSIRRQIRTEPPMKYGRQDIRREGFAREPIAIKASIIGLGVVVALCVGLLIPPLWTAVVEGWRSHPTSQACDKSVNAAVRHDCDELLGHRAPHPAKAGNAPIYRPLESRND